MAELKRLFDLGQTVATPAALAALEAAGQTYWHLLDRHITGDWGTLPDEDRQANEDALAHGLRIMSVYPVGENKVWVITEADRSATTLLLPDEY